MRGEVDGHADVADAGRERAGAAARDRDRPSTASPRSSSRPSSRTAGLKRSTWPTWTGAAPAADAAATIRSASAGVAASGFSTRTAMPRSIGGQREREVGRRRRGDDDGVEVGLDEHRLRLGVAFRARSPARRRARGRPGRGSETATSATSSRALEHAQVVPAHRPEPDETDARRAPADRLPAPLIARRSRGAGRSTRHGAGPRAMTVVLLVVGQTREHRQRQGPRGDARP